MTNLEQAAAFVRHRCGAPPPVACIAGSGMGALANRIEPRVRFRACEAPGFPQPTVAGHDGEIVCGRLTPKGASQTVPDGEVLLICGRRHLYEGCGLDEATFAVRLAAAVGSGTVVLLNAVGGLRPTLAKGDLVLASGYLAFGAWGGAFGPVFLRGDKPPQNRRDADRALRRKLLREAGTRGFPLREGVYGWVPGPNYETPAEIQALRRLGADVVGMSGAPEALQARRLGLRGVMVSLVTNVCSEVPRAATTHEEVLATAEAGHDTLHRFLEIVSDLDVTSLQRGEDLANSSDGCSSNRHDASSTHWPPEGNP